MTPAQPVDAVLLDTDVFSYLMKSGDQRGELYRPHIRHRLVAASFITVGELLFGAKKAKWGSERISTLDQRLHSVVIVPSDRQVCETYADLKARLVAQGRPVADNDLWIAACAVRHSVPLVSNNRAHFQVIPELVLISEETARL